MLRFLVLPLLLALLPSPPADPPAGERKLEGTYDVSGTNVDGTAYTGTLTVTRRGSVYQFSWATGNDYEGIGLLAGDFVAVGFGGEACGVVAYALDDGALEGVWGLYGQEAAGTERAVRTGGSGRAPAGSYAITGTNADGSAYEGTLSVVPHGAAFHLTWNAGGTSEGIGLRDGDVLAASYGDTTCGVVTYRVGEDGALDGTWTAFGLDGVGTERAVRQ
jgi:hypothetical protein